MSKQIPYSCQTISEDDIREVVETLKSSFLTCGPKVGEFEKALAKYASCKEAVVVSSGTAALHAAYFALGIKEGDEVITTPLTFSATAAGFCYLGAKPIFCEIDPKTLNIDPKEIEKKITKKTKAIAIVDFAGMPCDYKTIKQIAKKYKLPLIADGCHSFGGSYFQKKVGSLADLTCLSFHPVKGITTGEGGAILTNNSKLAQKMRVFRHHGAVKDPKRGGWYYEIKDLGYNYRLTDLQCALGLSQLKKLDNFIKKRREIAQRYKNAFAGLEEIVLQQEPKGIKSAYHLFVIQFATKNRKVIYEQLKAKGILTQVHYIPLNLQPAYQKYGYKRGDFPITEKYYSRCLSLPIYPTLTNAQQAFVIKEIIKLT
ncbi:UDP-4-amino-4,6-dideoxy-N-acetyl-beta-L-altrosamine transaminase [Candidatus Parcubacteria bacterium]|nr:UDP-4-amino-4,6-dideoxy-N-acetyl-beta-L-altrosamine transaminase [Candidatus Parcubacteria bacterium]